MLDLTLSNSATYTAPLYRVAEPPAVQLWRVPHDTERVNVNADDYRYRPNVGIAGRGPVRRKIVEAGVARPEPFRMKPDHTPPIGEAHQRLWKDINPDLSNGKWATLLGNKLAWTNGTGFPGHADYINRRDLDMDDPNFSAAFTDGGAIMEGVEVGDWVYLKTLLVRDPVPSAEAVLNSHLWRWGTSINPEGEINLIRRLGLDGQYAPVRILTLTREHCWLPAVELHRLPPGVVPEPTRVYL